MIYDILKIGRKRLTDLMNELINDEGVCRTAPAKPGLLIITVPYCLFIFAQLLQVVYQRWQWGDNHILCHLNTPLQVQTNITNNHLLQTTQVNYFNIASSIQNV